MEPCGFNMSAPCELNWGQLFFISLSLVPAALLLPSWCVAKFIWLPMRKKAKKDLRPFSPPLRYERRYPISQAKQERDNLDYIERNIIVDNTPEGLVYLRYNGEEKAFEYWSNRSVRYPYLETVARKYVTFFACKNLYVDRRALLMEKLTRLKKEIDENKKKDEARVVRDEGPDSEEEESIYATFKNYHHPGKNKVRSKLTKEDYVVDDANKYIKRGQIVDAFFGKATAELSSGKGISFGQWSKIFGN